MEINTLVAHVEWVVPGAEGIAPRWSEALRPQVLVALGAVVAGVAAWRLAGTRWGHLPQGLVDARLRWLTVAGPSIVRVGTGLSLCALTLTGDVLAPTVGRPDGLPGVAVLALQGVVGAALVDGRRSHRWGVVLAAMVVVLAATSDPVSFLEGAHLIGIALAIVLWGGASFAPRRGRSADLALRLGLATSLIACAFTEKLANPSLAAAALDHHPQLDLPATLGLPIPTELFVVGAGAVEVLFGLMVLSNRARAATSLVVAGPFLVTLAVFGLPELIGHLPIYAVLLAVAVTPASSPVTASEADRVPTEPVELAPAA